MTLIDDFVADCQLRGIRYPKTAIYYIRDFATTCEDLQNANRADLKRYLAILRGRNLKQSSIMKAYNHLSGFYEYLVDEELVTVNPVASFRKRYLQTYKEQIAQDVRQLISIEDASRLVNSTLDSRDKAILILLFKTGMRANELLALDVGDVDILKMEIRLKPTTKRSNRLLFFDEETAAILGAWLRARPLRSTIGGKNMTEEKEWVRLGGKDGVYLVEGEDYTVDRDAGLLTINEKAWAKVPAKCIKYPDVPVDVGYVEEGQEEMGNGGE